MCKCDNCTRSAAWQARTEGMTPEQKEMVEEMHGIILTAEMDRDYYRSIVRGTWPRADEVIASSREVQAKRNMPVIPPLAPGVRS